MQHRLRGHSSVYPGSDGSGGGTLLYFTRATLLPPDLIRRRAYSVCPPANRHSWTSAVSLLRTKGNCTRRTSAVASSERGCGGGCNLLFRFTVYRVWEESSDMYHQRNIPRFEASICGSSQEMRWLFISVMLSSLTN